MVVHCLPPCRHCRSCTPTCHRMMMSSSWWRGTSSSRLRWSRAVPARAGCSAHRWARGCPACCPRTTSTVPMSQTPGLFTGTGSQMRYSAQTQSHGGVVEAPEMHRSSTSSPKQKPPFLTPLPFYLKLANPSSVFFFTAQTIKCCHSSWKGYRKRTEMNHCVSLPSYWPCDWASSPPHYYYTLCVSQS